MTKLIESREPMIISLVLDVLICISLLAVQVSTEVKYDVTQGGVLRSFKVIRSH